MMPSRHGPVTRARRGSHPSRKGTDDLERVRGSPVVEEPLLVPEDERMDQQRVRLEGDGRGDTRLS